MNVTARFSPYWTAKASQPPLVITVEPDTWGRFIDRVLAQFAEAQRREDETAQRLLEEP